MPIVNIDRTSKRRSANAFIRSGGPTFPHKVQYIDPARYVGLAIGCNGTSGPGFRNSPQYLHFFAPAKIGSLQKGQRICASGDDAGAPCLLQKSVSFPIAKGTPHRMQKFAIVASNSKLGDELLCVRPIPPNV